MLLDSAFLLLLGIMLAGLVHVLLHEKNINRFLKGGKRSQIWKIALVGIPLPLCSCSVIPVAYQLRRSGVSKGGTAAFLIATPESGVDSILLTYSLMDPVMTVARPLSAFLAAITAGISETFFPDNDKPIVVEEEINQCETSCGCSKNSTQVSEKSLFLRLLGGVKYAFTDLLADLAVYLLIGYLLAGLVSALVGANAEALPGFLRSGWGSYAGALVIGVPLYICATSSTPFAAALLVAGFSPGAILVFLLVGPATNIASLTLVSKVLHGWATFRYLLSIVVVAVLSGLAVDWIYSHFHIMESFRNNASTESAGLISIIASFILSGFIIFYALKKLKRLLVK